VASSGTPIYRVERLKVITLAFATLSFAFFIEKLLLVNLIILHQKFPTFIEKKKKEYLLF